MRRLAVIGAALALAGCGGPERLVAFGHSYAAGDYPGAPAEAWPEIVAEDLGLELDNRAVSGAVSPEVAQVVRRYEPDPKDVVVIDAMLNDIRREGAAGVARWEESLTTMLEHLTADERPDRIVVLIDPPITGWKGSPPFDAGSDEALTAYKAPTFAIARRFDADVVDLAAGWSPSDVAADRLHPTPGGFERIAALVETALE